MIKVVMKLFQFSFLNFHLDSIACTWINKFVLKKSQISSRNEHIVLFKRICLTNKGQAGIATAKSQILTYASDAVSSQGDAGYRGR